MAGEAVWTATDGDACGVDPRQMSGTEGVEDGGGATWSTGATGGGVGTRGTATTGAIMGGA